MQECTGPAVPGDNLPIGIKRLGAPGWLSWLSIELWISAQVMISWFVGSSPASGCSLTVWSLVGILSLLLSLPLPPCLSLSLSLYLKINNKTNFKKIKKDLSRALHWIKHSRSSLLWSFSLFEMQGSLSSQLFIFKTWEPLAPTEGLPNNYWLNKE